MQHGVAPPVARTRSLPDSLALGATLAGICWAYGATLAPGLTWANSGADGGDLATALATGGVAHPSGYPTYLLLAGTWGLLPLGEPALRSNLFSALAALLTLLVLHRLVLVLLADSSWQSEAAACLAVLALGLSPLFWSQAVITEVHTLGALGAALLLLLTAQQLTADRVAPWRGRLHGLLIGATLGNHLTGGLIALVSLAALAHGLPAAARVPVCRRLLCWAGLGLLVYVALPLRAAANPPVNWGDATNWGGFWWLTTGLAYRPLAFGLPAAALPARGVAWAGLLLEQLGPAGLALSLGGLLYGRPHQQAQRLLVLSAGAAAGYSAFAIGYDTADSFVYLIPAYLLAAVWLGLGVARLLDALGRQHHWRGTATVTLLTAMLVGQGIATLPRVDASKDDRARIFAATVLAQAPRNAVVLTTSDRDSFTLWYYHFALQQRPDLFIVVGPLLQFAWYREGLAATYPMLKLPQQGTLELVDDLLASNRADRPLCFTSTTAAVAVRCNP